MEIRTQKFSECRQRPAIDHDYPLRMPCTFRAYRNGERIEEGSGETEVISSKAVRFSASRFAASQATEVSVSVAWPMTLEDGTALQLVFSGRPIWEDGKLTGICIERYQFRTRRAAAVVNRPEVYSIAGVPSMPPAQRATVGAA